MVLRASDLPGWQAVPHNSSNTGRDKQINAQLSACLQVTSTLLSQDNTSASADSPDFSMDSGAAQVQDSVEIDRTQTSIDAGFAVVQAAGFPVCLNAAFKSALQAQAAGAATVTDVETTTLDVTPLLDKTVATRTTVSLAVRGLSGPLFADFIFMRKARVVAVLFFLNGGTPFDVNQQRLLMDVVANRYTAAGAV
jgi:hypothetical protein